MEIDNLTLSRYQIISRLKTALLAEDIGTGQRCVIRSVKDFVDPGAAEFLGKIRHAGLPRLMERLGGNGKPETYVFEFLEGQSLAKIAREQGGRLPLEILLPIMVKAAVLLDFMHQQGNVSLLHLDLKPEHILVNSLGDVCFIDFGAARLLEKQRAGEPLKPIALTHGYAAPELHAGKPCPASDLFAFGIVFLELISGMTLSEINNQPLEALLPDDAKHLALVLQRLRMPNPSERYGSAAQLASDLLNGKTKHKPNASEPKSDQGCQHNNLICIWDGAEFGCELAAVIARNHEVMVVDADILNPQAEHLLGVEQKSADWQDDQAIAGLDLLMAESQSCESDWSRLVDALQKTKIPNIRLLATSQGFSGYDICSPPAFCRIIDMARQSGMLVIALCAPSVFDAFTCCLLKLSDHVVIPVDSGMSAMRQRKLAVDYMVERDFLDMDRISYAAMSYAADCDMSRGCLDELTGGRMIGIISQSSRRRKMRCSQMQYASHMEKSVVREYQKMIGKMALGPLKAVS